MKATPLINPLFNNNFRIFVNALTKTNTLRSDFHFALFFGTADKLCYYQ